jgi:hypothetical protein
MKNDRETLLNGEMVAILSAKDLNETQVSYLTRGSGEKDYKE